MWSNLPQHYLKHIPHSPPSCLPSAERKLGSLVAHFPTRDDITPWDLPSILNDYISNIHNLTWKQALAFAALLGQPVKPPVSSKQDVFDAIDNGFKKHFQKLEESKARVANETKSVWGHLLRNDPVGLDNMLKEYPSFSFDVNTNDDTEGNGDSGNRPCTAAAAAAAAATPFTPSSPRGRFGFFRRSLKSPAPLTSTLTTDATKQQGEIENLLMDKDDAGCTVLHAAVLLGYIDCIQVICEHAKRGLANPNKLLYAEQGSFRYNAIKYCLSGKNVDNTLELLLAEGIDLFVLPSDVNEEEKKKKKKARRRRRTDDTDPFNAGLGGVNENGDEDDEHDEREEEEEEEEWTDTPGDANDNSSENEEADLDAASSRLSMDIVCDPFFLHEYYRRTGWAELIFKACKETRFVSTLKKVLDGLSSLQSSFDINRAVPNRTLSSEVKEITAMQMAAYYTNLDVIDLLMSYNAKVDVGCVVFAIKGMKVDNPYAGMYLEDEDEEAGKFKELMHLQIIETLVRSGVDLNEQFGRRKQTPLLQATREGNKMIVDYLLQKRVNVSVKDYEGRNAATLAEGKGFRELAEMLKRSRQLSRLFSTNSNSSSSRREGNNKECGEVEEELPREEACICCMERRKEVIFAPCGHRLVCRRCFRENIGTSEAMQKCMVCKENIVSWILKVYE